MPHYVPCGPRSARLAQLRPSVGVAALVAAALLAAGCGTDSAAEAPPPSSPATVAPPATTTTSVDPAVQDRLVVAVTQYLAVYDSVYADPTQDLAVVDTVAGGQEAASLRDQASQVAEQGLVVEGSVELLRLRVDDITPSPAEGGPTTANVTTCNDVSGTTVTNPDGTSNVDPNRLAETQAELQLQNTTPASPDGWRVTQVRTGPTVACDAT